MDYHRRLQGTQLIQIILCHNHKSRVDWAAKSSHEYVANYKLLQSAFNKNKIRKHVDVDKLIRGKYQDNLEFCQWLKAFFDQTCGMMNGMRENYDPVAVRARGKGGKSVERSKAGGGRPAAARNAGAAAKAPRAAAVKAPRAAPPSVGRPASSTSRTTGAAARSKENIANTSSTTTGSISTSKPRKVEDTTALKALQEENSRLQSKVADLETLSAELELNVHNSQAERDFYFHKLRGIEIMLQVFKDKEESGDAAVDLGVEARKVIERAFKVMYATDQDNIDVDDEGNVSLNFFMQIELFCPTLLCVFLT